MMLRIIPLALLFVATASFGQSPACPCCTDHHQGFDFWVGNWNVYDTTGKLVGENEIVKLEDNCIINEHWKGASGTTGRSYNYFNRADSTWNQVWVDNGGNSLVLKGRATPGVMILESEPKPGKKVKWYKNRVTWTLNKDGSVLQLWQIVDDQDKVLSEAFRGIYRKK